MRPDPGRHAQESLIAGMSPARRAAISMELRERGLHLVWQQADQAGISDPLARADFVLRRLYPEMAEQWFADVVGKLAKLHAAGTWHGFERHA
jgi:hypothetical protein